MNAEWTSPEAESLAAEARQLAIYARQTTAYKKDPVFRRRVDDVMKSTQFVSDRAVDELLDELECPTKEEQIAQKPVTDKGLPMWIYFLVAALAAGGIVAGVAEVMAWWRIAFRGCNA